MDTLTQANVHGCTAKKPSYINTNIFNKYCDISLGDIRVKYFEKNGKKSCKANVQQKIHPT